MHSTAPSYRGHPIPARRPRSRTRLLAMGARMHVLAPAGWASSTSPAWLHEAPPSGVLVRRVLGPPAAVVLSGERGWARAGRATGAWRWRWAGRGGAPGVP